jgi:hypothetical protein
VPKCSFGFSILNVKLGYLNTLKVKKKLWPWLFFTFKVGFCIIYCFVDGSIVF